MSKIEAAPKNIEAVARELADLRQRKEAISEEETNINKRIQHLQTQVLPPMFEALGDKVKSFRIEGLGTLSKSNEAFVFVAADNREKLYADLRASGNGDLITEAVHPGTLRSFVLEQLEQGNALPDVVKVTYQPTVKLRKS